MGVEIDLGIEIGVIGADEVGVCARGSGLCVGIGDSTGVMSIGLYLLSIFKKSSRLNGLAVTI